MEQFENVVEQFEEKHPVWFWVLVRLLVCLCWFFVVCFGLLALCVVVLTIFALCSDYGTGCLWALIAIPVLITICLATGAFAVWLYDEYIY